MEMQQVESSHIESIGYDSGGMELRVKFKSGAIYVYSNVPALEAHDLVDADSVGKYLNDHIKGQYDYRKI